LLPGEDVLAGPRDDESESASTLIVMVAAQWDRSKAYTVMLAQISSIYRSSEISTLRYVHRCFAYHYFSLSLRITTIDRTCVYSCYCDPLLPWLADFL
jgi:hypothetical protein